MQNSKFKEPQKNYTRFILQPTHLYKRVNKSLIMKQKRWFQRTYEISFVVVEHSTGEQIIIKIVDSQSNYKFVKSLKSLPETHVQCLRYTYALE